MEGCIIEPNYPEPRLIEDARRQSYDRIMDLRKTSLELQGHYGKWLTSSLLLIHGATIGFISHNERLSSLLIPDVFYIAVAGLILALLCGFVTWINWGLNFRVFDTVHPAMVFDDKHWPKLHENPHNRWVALTFWLSLVAGIASLGCTVWGAILAARLLATTVA